MKKGNNICYFSSLTGEKIIFCGYGGNCSQKDKALICGRETSCPCQLERPPYPALIELFKLVDAGGIKSS